MPYTSMALIQIKSHIHQMETEAGDEETNFDGKFPLTGKKWREVDIVGYHRDMVQKRSWAIIAKALQSVG